MSGLAVVAGLTLIAAALLDAFVTVVLPRRVTRYIEPSQWLLLGAWRGWRWLARRLPARNVESGANWRELLLALFGPLVLVGLVALWAATTVVGFALLSWGAGVPLSGPAASDSFPTALYLSGVTFFTLGNGDVAPASGLGRVLAVVEASLGLGFLALIIAYLPTIYAAASQREPIINLLDARAGSPPTAGAFLSQLGEDTDALERSLQQWEEWAAQILESHLSYPILAFFRSQHDRQSWLMTAIFFLDVSSLVIVGLGSRNAARTRQARLTFAIARHVLVDLCQPLEAPPRHPSPDRLPPEDLAALRALLAASGQPLTPGDAANRRLADLRDLYEPYACALSDQLLLALPPWLPDPDALAHWETSEWEQDPRPAREALGTPGGADPVHANGPRGGPRRILEHCLAYPLDTVSRCCRVYVLKHRGPRKRRGDRSNPDAKAEVGLAGNG